MTRVVPTYTPAVSDDEAASTTSTLASMLPQTTGSSDDATVEIHPLPDKDGLIVKIQPPQAPRDGRLSHVPCDIVLVIDVSGSMSTEAQLPGGSEEESTGLSVLDLVKHACRTILSTLNAGDRLAIITFSNKATVIQGLTVMTDANKKTAEDNINAMHVQGATNLWAGLKKGIETLNNEEKTDHVPAVLVLTDGLPNHMCPPGGYVPALRALGDIIPTIHTFGFGYELRSGLLKSVAEYGRGNYAFICDAGMIGTVFVHAVAHLQSTFATQATLYLKYPSKVSLEQTAGSSIDGLTTEMVGQDSSLVIALGNIQYGQSRDIYLRWKSIAGEDEKQMKDIKIQATLQYGVVTDSRTYASPHYGAPRWYGPQSRLLTAYTNDLTSAEIAYHISRHQILAFLASIFPLDPLGEHRTSIPLTRKAPKHFSSPSAGKTNSNKAKEQEEPPSEALTQTQAALRTLIATIPAANFPTDPLCASLMQDLTGPEPYGQISLALSKQAYFRLWGQHYLPSLHGAHARQLCNSFKDPGPLQYGTTSPLFLACRNALNAAFDDLPPPAPSILPVPEEQQRHHPAAPGPRGGIRAAFNGVIAPFRGRSSMSMADGRSFRPSTNMSEWNSRDNPCFAAETMVTLSGGGKVRIDKLQAGYKVKTPKGPRAVAAVLMTPILGARRDMVKVHGVLVTPWHPVMLPGESQDSASAWVFPCQASEETMSFFRGNIFSILLQEDADVDAHAIQLSDGKDGKSFWGVTLGHGILNDSDGDPRAHPFLGNYELVASSLKTLTDIEKGRFLAGGTEKSMETGLVCGFRRYHGFVGKSFLGLSLNSGVGWTVRLLAGLIECLVHRSQNMMTYNARTLVHRLLLEKGSYGRAREVGTSEM